MLQYCNAYSCAVNKSKEEVVVNLIQNAPIIGADGNFSGSEAHVVASVVLRPNVAQQLAKDLTELVADLIEQSNEDGLPSED